MSTQRILLLSYIVLGLLAALVLEQGILAVSGIGPLAFLSRSLGGLEGWSIGTLVAFVLAAAGGVYAWRNVRVNTLATEVVQELQLVTWPTMAETRSATYAVIVATLVAAVMLGSFDYAWGMLTQKVVYAR